MLEEAAGVGVVAARADVVQPGLGVELQAGVCERVGDVAHRERDAPEAVVLVSLHNLPGGVCQRDDAAVAVIDVVEQLAVALHGERAVDAAGRVDVPRGESAACAVFCGEVIAVPCVVSYDAVDDFCRAAAFGVVGVMGLDGRRGDIDAGVRAGCGGAAVDDDAGCGSLPGVSPFAHGGEAVQRVVAVHRRQRVELCHLAREVAVRVVCVEVAGVLGQARGAVIVVFDWRGLAVRPVCARGFAGDSGRLFADVTRSSPSYK